MAKKESKLFYFEKKRTTKANWEDAECDICHDSLWEQGEVKFAWLHVADPWIQVCERCFENL